jgi:hypothetical protein
MHTDVRFTDTVLIYILISILLIYIPGVLISYTLYLQLRGNLIANMVRETSDHGPFNSWDRVGY